MEKFNIKRDGVEVASDVEEKTYTDTGLTADTDYNYTVEIEGVEGSEASLTTRTKKPPTILVSSKELTWNDLPAYQQPDNGSLKLVSTEVKDNVPVVVETGEMVERHNFKTKELEQVPETVVQYETRATFTYKADFDWDNNSKKQLTWLVDVLQFKNNQLKTGRFAFYSMPAAELTAIPNLDTSNLTNMESMFNAATAFNQSLDNFDTSNVEVMVAMFTACSAFNQPLNFDTRNVSSMFSMFSQASAFNQPINFDTSSLLDMMGMFGMATLFNQPLNFDTRNVSNMMGVFNMATNFNQDISNWCVSQIASKPLSFDSGSGFAGQTAKQPKWGQPC